MKRLWHTLLIGAIGGIVIGYLMALGFSTFFNTTYLFPSNPTFVSLVLALSRHPAFDIIVDSDW